MPSRTRRVDRSIFWASLTLAVPFAYASLYVASGGPPKAEGCSGAGPGTEMGVTGLYADAEASVASDAFVVITAEVRNMDVETALSSVTLEVRDAAGELVEGTTEVLRDHVVLSGLSHVSMGWWANAEREPGELLALRASATSSVRSVELVSQLVIHDLEPVLELPEFELTSWSEVTGDRGATQTCTPLISTCPLSFGVETYVGRWLSLSAPPVSDVVVGWEYRFEPVPGKGTFAQSPPLYDAIPDTNFSPTLEFSEVLSEYCVQIVGRDLRTSEEVSREWCTSPAPPFETTSYDSIQGCQSAPIGFEERWCRAKQANGSVPSGACDAILNPSGGSAGQPGVAGADTGGQPSAGGAGAGGQPGVAGAVAGGQPGSSGAGDGGIGSEPPPGDSEPSAGESTSGDSSSTVRTNAGCGCRTSRTTTLPASALLVLVGLLGARIGRRRAAKRHQTDRTRTVGNTDCNRCRSLKSEV